MCIRIYNLANKRTSLPYASTNTDVVRAITTELSIPNCSASWPLAGAIMEDDTGLMNVKADTIAVAAHFCLKPQLQ